MLTNKQKEKIYNLISQKQEGAYWDFKREWYSKEKQADLLHDIICMANNMECRDAYIIIGIDEEKECSIQDVKNDSNRRNTQKMVDFLRDKKFAGGVRPNRLHQRHHSLKPGLPPAVRIQQSQRRKESALIRRG